MRNLILTLKRCFFGGEDTLGLLLLGYVSFTFILEFHFHNKMRNLILTLKRVVFGGEDTLGLLLLANVSFTFIFKFHFHNKMRNSILALNFFHKNISILRNCILFYLRFTFFFKMYGFL